MEFISAKKNLNEYMWMGVVDDNVDPKRRGRLKIRVQSLFDDLDTADIPWACPYNDIAGKAFSLPAVGKIVNVIVNVGDKVAEDDQIATLEAMKMEMPIVAPVAGTIKEIKVVAGQDVEADAILAIIE